MTSAAGLLGPTALAFPPGAHQSGTCELGGAKESFFSSYKWCLNPRQTFAALCGHAHDELARLDSLAITWQRAESRANLFLLLCAACCTLEDYLAHRPCDLSPAVRRLPGLRTYIRAVESSLNTAAKLRRLRGTRAARLLREELAHCIDLVCEILVDSGDGSPLGWANLGVAMRCVSCTGLPNELLNWRSRIPEAFRCQDMSHLDALAMAQRFLRAAKRDDRSVFVVGLRTAGAYFAPLVKAFLAAEGFPVVGWMSIRPKFGMSREERARFVRAVTATTRVVVVDDHPNTGATFAKVLELLDGLGLTSERVVFLAPGHPAQLDWSGMMVNARPVILPFSELHKHRLLQDDAAIACILGDLYGQQGWTDVSLQASAQVETLNAELAAHFPDTFEVRLKRAYRVRLCRAGASPTERYVVAKSVGWGWLGYHAVLAAVRLAEFVPPLVGLRQGLLFSEWVGPPDRSARRPTPAQIIPRVAKYVAARVNRLSLDVGPGIATLGVESAGWDSLLRTLCLPYGRFLGPLFRSRLQASLEHYRSPQPTLIDGKMGPDEWVVSGAGTLKLDFEHHNFGGAQQDVVDGCYDLACAIRDLDMSPADEELLLAQYSRETGDAAASERLPFYKLLCGIAAMRTAAYCVVRGSSRDTQEGWNISYNRARDFLNVQMARHCALSSPWRQTPPCWSSRLFFLDLDGVFDAEYLGPLFQHTTPSGVQALALLVASGYSVVLNTGRSVEHVKRYCEIYSLPGGVAEYGSVFFDAVENSEVPLVDERTLLQLNHCRAQLEQMPGVFADPGYRWSLRAYRYSGGLTIGLGASELAGLLAAHNLDQLDFIVREADSHIVQKGIDKGTGVLFVKGYLPRHQGPVVAIGDSAQDLCMFEQTDVAYIPRNFVPAHRAAVRAAKYRLLRTARQSGLLDAARDLTGQTAPERRCNRSRETGAHLLDTLLSVAEWPRHRRLLHILSTPFSGGA